MALSLNKPRLDNLTNEIWKSAERLRGKFKAYEYQGCHSTHHRHSAAGVRPAFLARGKAHQGSGEAAQAYREGSCQAGQGTRTESQTVAILEQDPMDITQSLRGRSHTPGRKFSRLYQRLLEER